MGAIFPPWSLFTALRSVLRTTGALLYRTASGLGEIAIGSTHHVLTVAGGVPTWAAGSKATLTTTGDRLVASSANTLARLPVGTVALSVVEGTPDTCAVDFAAGTAFTATLDEATTFTWSNETYGHQAILLKLTTSGTVAEPTWPAGMTRIGSGAWVTTTATVNYVHVFRLATGTYIYTVAQAA